MFVVGVNYNMYTHIINHAEQNMTVTFKIICQGHIANALDPIERVFFAN